jgi:hypothetical protein
MTLQFGCNTRTTCIDIIGKQEIMGKTANLTFHEENLDMDRICEGIIETDNVIRSKEKHWIKHMINNKDDYSTVKHKSQDGRTLKEISKAKTIGKTETIQNNIRITYSVIGIKASLLTIILISIIIILKKANGRYAQES